MKTITNKSIYINKITKRNIDSKKALPRNTKLSIKRIM